jgi:D-xylose transport system ATP-binding protein
LPTSTTDTAEWEFDPAESIRLIHLRRTFGSVVALADASLEIPFGQVTALVGDNGAGKSTLVKLLSGVYTPDSGEIQIRGTSHDFYRPRDAQDRGIHTVFQDLALAENLDVVENLFLGQELRVKVGPFSLPWLARRRMEAEAAALLDELGITTIKRLDLDIDGLSGGQRQTVAIARATKDNADLVILDEPTAALGVVQTEQVMNNIRRVREKGSAVLLISHNFREIFEVADRIAVMRLGQVVKVFQTAATDEHSVVSAIVGAQE